MNFIFFTMQAIHLVHDPLRLSDRPHPRAWCPLAVFWLIQKRPGFPLLWCPLLLNFATSFCLKTKLHSSGKMYLQTNQHILLVEYPLSLSTLLIFVGEIIELLNPSTGKHLCGHLIPTSQLTEEISPCILCEVRYNEK